MPDLAQTFADIKRLHRERCYHMDTRKSIDLRLGAGIRTALGWTAVLPKKEREKIETAASRIMAGKDQPAQFERMVANTAIARTEFENSEGICADAMANLVKPLAIWKDFGKTVRGFGEVSLGVIIAEAGDLANYPSDAHLWKRFGLAPGQNKVPPNLSKEDRKNAWIERGYNPMRRSRMFVIGDSLFKGQVRKVKDADGNDTGERIALGPYGEAYLRRKLRTQQTHPEWWTDQDGNAKLDEKTGRPTSQHGHNDAQRYMEKKLLRDLWRAWRRTKGSVSERTILRLSAARSIAAE